MKYVLDSNRGRYLAPTVFNITENATIAIVINVPCLVQLVSLDLDE